MRTLSWAALLLGLSACGKLVGADEYSYGTGDTVQNPCLADEVLTDDRVCAKVGVRPEMCNEGFEPHPEGGCTATLPSDCPTGLTRIGSGQCAAFNDATCGSDGFPGVGNAPVEAVYVRAGAGEKGDGTPTAPYRSISQALERAPAGKAVALLVSGNFDEDVEIVRPDVTITSCPGGATVRGQQTLRSQGPNRCFPLGLERLKVFRGAALCVAAGADNVTLDGLTVTGKGDGIQIFGARGVHLTRLSIKDPGYYGLRLVEVKTEGGIRQSEAELSYVAIHGAHGAGIVGVGAKLTIADSSIERTVSLNDWADGAREKSSVDALIPERDRLGWARGVVIYPGWWPLDPNRAAPEDYYQSYLEIERSVVTGHKEVAVYAAGTDARLEHVFLGATAGGERSGRGLVAEQSLSTGKETTVTVLDSVIERAGDAAVDVLDADVTLERTTIRDTQGRLGDGCSGQGIRVRTLPLDRPPAAVTVTDSTIANSRQAGVFAASAKVTLTRTQISGSSPGDLEAPCALAMGDGLALETYQGQAPSHVTLNRVRIEGAARAAIANGGADLELHSTVLGCGERRLVDASGLGAPALVPGAICGCEDRWSTCRFSTEPLSSWLLSGPSAVWPDAMQATPVCFSEFGQTAKRIEGAVASHHYRPEVVPAGPTDSNGCTTSLRGSRGEVTGGIIYKPRYDPNMPTVPNENPRAGFLTLAASTINTGLGGWPSTSLVFIVQRAPLGSRLDMKPATLPYLDALSNVLPDQKLLATAETTATFGSIFYVPVMEPGWYTFSLSELPPGTVCRPEETSLGEGAVRFARIDWGAYGGVAFYSCEPL